ncbi:hypothetical protein [Acinetobacter modestus]|uniref:hypothetical protein n=1 Tax=Acinetobacter modestus TaxID=1776740 RepID=UPI00301A5F1E
MYGFPDVLKIVDSKTNSEVELNHCRIDNNKIIFSKQLDASVKFGDTIIKTHADGFVEEFKVKAVQLHRFAGLLEIKV